MNQGTGPHPLALFERWIAYCGWAGAALVSGALALAFGGSLMWLIGWKIVTFLRTAEWPDFGTLHALIYIIEDWDNVPMADWQGLWLVIFKTPLWLFQIAGLIGSVYLYGYASERSRAISIRED